MFETLGRLAMAPALALALGANATARADLLGAAEAAAYVYSVTGSAERLLRDGARRPLACGDLLLPGERVHTAAGARVGALSGEVLVQIDERSDVGFAWGDAAPELDLARGRVRSFDDSGLGAPPLVIVTPNAIARAVAADVETYVLRAGGEPSSVFCAGERGLDVTRRFGAAERIEVQPGECAFVKPGRALYTAVAPERRIALAATESCLPPDLIGMAAERFVPARFDVPARPPIRGYPPPPDPDGHNPCDDPAALCDPTPPIVPTGPPPPPIVPVEPPAVPDCPPGGDC